MIEEILDKKLYDNINKACEKVRGESYVRVLAHNDGDGVSSAIILLNALKKLNIKFHLSFVKSLDNEGFRQLFEEEKDPLTIVVDAGSSQIPGIIDYDNYIILDHHFYNPVDGIRGININIRDYGINGTREACGSTMAYIFSLVLDESNRNLFPFFLSGVTSDKQDIGGLSGLNKTIYDAYNTYSIKHTLNLEGNLGDAITYSLDPFFNGLTGNPDAVRGFLQSLNINFDKNVLDLNDDENKVLANALALKLLENNIGSDGIRYIEGDTLYYSDLNFTSKELVSIIDGNSRVGENSLPVQYFLGDNSVRLEMLNNIKIYKTKLIDYIYRANSEITEEKYLRYFYAPESEMAGPIAGAIALYLMRPDKPVIGFNSGNDDIKISSRGTRALIARGLNLSEVMSIACKKAGGSGGGHDIAAGGVIPPGREKIFIEAASEIIKSQIHPL
ncbi:DHH family phosphoesterase [Acidiplasma sp.]|uniref:DHH family phosphoesterase n=1 Tax=Acidiplasma sp. TaxID=1872114 RepID=UPI00258DE7F2|nr:DHH family phosphoesterase [Acidiplasma sp.]